MYTRKCGIPTIPIFALVCFFAVMASQGQVTSITDQTQTPIADSGHDYIQDLQETVNPANGQVSIRINIPTGKGRGYSLPFSINYDSGSRAQPEVISGHDYVEMSTGRIWSYSIPFASRSETHISLGNTDSGMSTDANAIVENYYNCAYSQDYMYWDPEGGSHALYLTSYILSPDGVMTPPIKMCAGESVLGDSGDGNVTAMLDSPVSLNSDFIGKLDLYPRLRVIDKAGTVSTFFAPPANNPISDPIEATQDDEGNIWRAFPSTIEDHNGNLYTFDWQKTTIDNSGTTASFYGVSPGNTNLTVTDSLGRNALSITPTSVTLPGGNQYLINSSSIIDDSGYSIYIWTPLATPDNNYIYIRDPCYSVEQPIGALGHNVTVRSASGSTQIITSIVLPNGQSYQFYYKADLVSEIDYPSGARVQYQWQEGGIPLNGQTSGPPSGTTNAMTSVVAAPLPRYGLMSSSGPGPVSPPHYVFALVGGNPNCYVLYNPPVIQSRSVYLPGGTSPISTQTYSYTTDTSVLVAQQYPARTAPYKTTDVTTTDLVTGKQYLTHYSYAPSYPSRNGNAGYTHDADFISPSPKNLPPVPAEQSIVRYDGSTTSSAVLSTTTKSFYQGHQTPTQQLCEFNTSASGLTTGHFFDYLRDGKIIDDKEYGYGSNATSAKSICLQAAQRCPYGISGCSLPTPDRETVTNYQGINSPNGKTLRETTPASFTVPQSVVVYNGSAAAGIKVKETDYYYDQSIVTQASVPIGAHDDTAFPAGNPTSCPSTISGNTTLQPCRGNLTQVSEQCLSGNNCTPLVKYFTYDYTGRMTSMTDGRGNTINASYTDSPSGGNAAGNSNAYLTKLSFPSTNGVAHVRSFQYDYTKSRMTQSTDENSQTTTYLYNDPLVRLTDVIEPTTAHTSYSYVDGASPTVTTTGPTGIVSVDTSDGLGRKTSSAITSAIPILFTPYVTYNGLGTVASAYNPTNCNPPTSNCGESTWGITTFAYDSLGRKTQQTQPDGTKRQWCYENIASTGQSNCHASLSKARGTWVDFMDEKGNDWQRTTDAFGRLVAVMEPNGTTANPPTMETDYAYDLLNNLLFSAQNGQPGDTARNRTFVYNSLSQLVQSYNPEAGTISYAYDANGNLLNKTDVRLSPFHIDMTS